MADRKELVTRTELRRALVVNAVTKPLNVAVPAAVVVAALGVGASWLLVVAAVAYVALSALTFFDEAEAERVGRRTYGDRRGVGQSKRVDPRQLAAPIAAQVQSARACEARIQDTIERSDSSLAEVGGEVDSLVRAIESIAQRAQRIYEYLATQDIEAIDARLRQLRGATGPAERSIIAALREQRDALADLQDQLTRFYTQIEQLVASLGTVNSQLVRMSVAREDVDEHELSEQVRGLREQVSALDAGMKEAYGRAPETLPPPA
jgi:archaellum component FlaC